MRGLLLYFAPGIPPALPLFSRQSCGHVPVNGFLCQVDLKRALLLNQVKTSRSFDSGPSYRISSLALVQAVAWLGERCSMLSGEREEIERESCCEEKR